MCFFYGLLVYAGLCYVMLYTPRPKVFSSWALDGNRFTSTPWAPPDSSTTSYGESTEGVSGSRVGSRGSDFSMRKNWRQPMGWRVGFRGSGFPVWKNLCFFQRVGFPGSRFSIAKTRRVGFPVFMAAGRVSRVGFIPRKNEAGRVFGTLLL